MNINIVYDAIRIDMKRILDLLMFTTAKQLIKECLDFLKVCLYVLEPTKQLHLPLVFILHFEQL